MPHSTKAVSVFIAFLVLNGSTNFKSVQPFAQQGFFQHYLQVAEAPVTFKLECAAKCMGTHRHLCRAVKITTDANGKFGCQIYSDTLGITNSSLLLRKYPTPTSPDCWLDKLNHNPVGGLLKYGTVGENRPEIFYFGLNPDIEWCKQQCANEPLCYVYVVHKTGDHWNDRCHGRGFGAPEQLGPQSNIHCGIKMC